MSKSQETTRQTLIYTSGVPLRCAYPRAHEGFVPGHEGLNEGYTSTAPADGVPRQLGRPRMPLT